MLTHDSESQNGSPSQKTGEQPIYSETVLATDNEQEVMSCSLVLSAVGISHKVSQALGKAILLVSADNLHAAQFQIQAYVEENENWPPAPDNSVDSFVPFLQPPTLLLIGALALFFSVTGPWSAQSLWFTQGAGNAQRILQNHEYYRLVTALTLHADTVHLLGNCFFGGFLFHFFCKLTGNGIGMFAMLMTATLGNFINVTLHETHHLFVGFSTAVFAIIGMLAMLNRHNRVSKHYVRVIPFMAGAALLAMIGSSGERTDLGAHLFGLCCGFGTGWLLGRPFFLRLRDSIMLQTSLFILSCGIIIFAWKAAFS
jgi:membrane associated rhomboid family serine protease